MNFTNYKCKWIERDELWQIADDRRNWYWPEGTLPINMENIIEIGLKLGLEFRHGLFSLVDTDAFLKLDLSGIVVDYNSFINEKFANRLRFSLAHEVGHYFLHGDLYSTLEINFLEEWVQFINALPEDEYGRFEWQANEFAGRFLVPRQELEAQLQAVINSITNPELHFFLQRDPDAFLAGISPRLRKVFGVSEAVIETRLKREGLWPPQNIL